MVFVIDGDKARTPIRFPNELLSIMDDVATPRSARKRALTARLRRTK
jgi:hypothetical protein